IALEEAEHGITANMICPGDITGDMKESNIQMAKSIRDQKTPVGRPGSGGDIARLIDFLCQEDSDLITGSIIVGSGGIDVVNRKLSYTLFKYAYIFRKNFISARNEVFSLKGLGNGQKS